MAKITMTITYQEGFPSTLHDGILTSAHITDALNEALHDFALFWGLDEDERSPNFHWPCNFGWGYEFDGDNDE